MFISQASVMKYLGAKANKILAYGVASVSGTILAVCYCMGTHKTLVFVSLVVVMATVSGMIFGAIWG